ncbi:MAG: efflux RND transporter permease subunit, partial [Candidatus Hydrogenedentes bacterium]|nr:efflux RND transporter permease subunit [Candidatus Hydrogenedentota bacterium]
MSGTPLHQPGVHNGPVKAFLGAVIGNTIFANVAMFALLFVGGMALFNIRRESMPEISLHALQVSIPFPGADPQEVEEGVSRRVEAAVDGLEGVKQYNTSSYEGASYAMIELEEGYSIEEMKDRVGDALDGISTFPATVEKPRIVQIKDEEQVLNLALWGPLPERQLKEWAEEIRLGLQQLPEISLVYVAATRPYEVKVEVSRERLLESGLTLEQISQVIQRANLNATAGAIENEREELTIRTLGKKYTGKEFAETVVKAGPAGEVVRLDQVATVTDGFVDNPVYATFNGHPCVFVSVFRGQGEDTLAIADAVKAFAAEKQKELPGDLHISPCFDDSEFIRGQIDLLASDGLSGLLLVVVLLWLFLNTRLAFWVSTGIPISFAGALAIMWAIGYTLNQISLIAFIIVLGIVVDDAIVISEAIYVHRSRGKAPLQAAVDGLAEVGLPVIAAVLTTVAAFLPLAFVGGVMGQILAIMPVVVLASLGVSLFESLFLLPAHLNHLPDPQAEYQQAGPTLRAIWRLQEIPGRWLQRFADRVYAPVVRAAVRRRYLSIAGGIAAILLTAGIVGGGLVRVVFWPPVDGNILEASLEFPPGTPAEVTRDAINRTREGLERVAGRTPTLSGAPLIRNLYTFVYPGSSNMGEINVEMLDTSERGVHAQDVAAAWEKEVGAIPGAVAQTFMNQEIQVGGLPIEIWLQGRNMEDLLAASAEIKEKLKGYRGVYQVSDDFRPGKTEVQVRMRPEAHTLGLTLSDVARQLRGGYYGEEAVRFQRGHDDVRVRVQLPESERATLTQLQQTRIATPLGEDVPLLSIVDVDLAQGYSSIRGTNGMRRLRITAAVDANVANAQEVLDELAAGYLDGVVARFDQVRWDFRGAAESNQETVKGLKVGFGFAVIAIFVIMATTFRSYMQPFVILLVVPFAVVGAVLGHLIMGIPLT